MFVLIFHSEVIVLPLKMTRICICKSKNAYVCDTWTSANYACLLACSCDTSTWGYKCELSVSIITADFYSLCFVVSIDRLYRSNYFNVMIHFFVKSTFVPFSLLYMYGNSSKKYVLQICDNLKVKCHFLEIKSFAKQDDVASKTFRENQIFVYSIFFYLFKHTYWVKTQFFNTRTKRKHYKNLKKTRLMCPPINYYTYEYTYWKKKFLIQRHWGWTFKKKIL